MSYTEFYCDSMEFVNLFAGDVKLILSSDDERRKAWEKAENICSSFGNCYFPAKVMATLLGEVSLTRLKQTEQERRTLKDYKHIFSDLWYFHERNAASLGFDDIRRQRLEEDYRKELSHQEDKLGRELLKIVRDWLLIESFSFCRLTDDVIEKWNIKPLYDGGTQAWQKEKNFPKAS